MNMPIVGATYREKKSGKLYIVEGFLPHMKDGIWDVYGVTIYISSEDKKINKNQVTNFGMMTPDFIDSFDLVHED